MLSRRHAALHGERVRVVREGAVQGRRRVACTGFKLLTRVSEVNKVTLQCVRPHMVATQFKCTYNHYRKLTVWHNCSESMLRLLATHIDLPVCRNRSMTMTFANILFIWLGSQNVCRDSSHLMTECFNAGVCNRMNI